MSQAEFQGKETGKSLRYDEPALIALGSNISSRAGLPEVTLRQALDEMVKRGISIRTVSRFYRTPAFPAGSGPDFVNAAAVIDPGGSPAQLLDSLHEIEAALDRAREVRWGPRTLDLDLLAIADLVVPDAQTYKKWCNLPAADQQTQAPEQLILPHPRLQDRAFVLVPLCDVAPHWRHPVLNKTAQQMLDALPEALKNEVVALE